MDTDFCFLSCVKFAPTTVFIGVNLWLFTYQVTCLNGTNNDENFRHGYTRFFVFLSAFIRVNLWLFTHQLLQQRQAEEDRQFAEFKQNQSDDEMPF